MTELNLMNKTLHFFAVVALFKNDQTKSIKNYINSIFKYHFQIALM